MLICADDDWQTEGNPGRTMAKRTARALGRCDLVWPVFPLAGRGKKDTDFNDLHLRAGLHAVRRQIGRAVALVKGVRLAGTR